MVRYRQAFEHMHDHCANTYETGLVAELRKELGNPAHGDIAALNRLTLVLRKLGRFEGIVESVEPVSRFILSASRRTIP